MTTYVFPGQGSQVRGMGSALFPEFPEFVQKANDILHRLGVGLKYEAGPIAEQLDTLYNFMATELIEANLKKDKQKIQGVLRIIGEIAGAWNTAMKTTVSSTQKINKKVAAYESSIMRTNQ